ncbi:hypothetical protein ABZ770_44130 [Streptomyces sp. NPDC006654]|uniref:hypothetical protein n=1 Tax=Streptomyces sp. NPDC006654 TaxID=3156897 RepID=UPI0033EC1B1D
MSGGVVRPSLLTVPRGHDGHLPRHYIQESVADSATHARHIANLLEEMKKGHVTASISRQRIMELIADRNSHYARSYPQLLSYVRRDSDRRVDRSTSWESESLPDIQFASGAPLYQVHYDPTDALRDEHLGNLTRVTRMISEQFDFPPGGIKVYLSKYGGIALHVDEEGIRGEVVSEDDLTSEFVPPNHLFVMPYASKRESSYVHELGHYFHAQSHPGAFYDLSRTTWVSDASREIAKKVSDYAASSPSEFIAEVFVKIVTRENVDIDVMEMYRALGGPLPGKRPRLPGWGGIRISGSAGAAG